MNIKNKVRLIVFACTLMLIIGVIFVSVALVNRRTESDIDTKEGIKIITVKDLEDPYYYTMNGQ